MSDEQKPEGRNVGLSAGLDDTALKAAAAKLRKLRLTDVHGRKEAPCETVKSALKRGLGGLYDDEAVAYILRHGLKYYIAALSSNDQHEGPEASAACRRSLSMRQLGGADHGGQDA